jgi:outer membrane protein assembly factor BamB
MDIFVSEFRRPRNNIDWVRCSRWPYPSSASGHASSPSGLGARLSADCCPGIPIVAECGYYAGLAHLYALDPTTGQVMWTQQLSAPESAGSLPCGNISQVGITGTPTVRQTLAAGQLTTISTNRSAACTTVTVGSSDGWWTNFDNVTYSN